MRKMCSRLAARPCGQPLGSKLSVLLCVGPATECPRRLELAIQQTAQVRLARAPVEPAHWWALGSMGGAAAATRVRRAFAPRSLRVRSSASSWLGGRADRRRFVAVPVHLRPRTFATLCSYTL